MSAFITGVTEKYPKELLEGRLGVEGNCVFSFWKDPNLYQEYKEITINDFLTEDARFYFSLGEQMSKLYKVFDEVSVISYIGDNETILAGFNERGGYDIVYNTMEMLNINNVEQYIDVLNRENILLKLHEEGFNLLNKIIINNKEIIPIKLLRRMSAAETLQFFESRISNIGIRVRSNDMEISDLDIEDNFIEKLETGMLMGIPFDIGGKSQKDNSTIYASPLLSNISMGINKGELTLVGGFSGSGKTSLSFSNFVMPMVYRGEKVCITANEQRKIAWQILIMIYTLVHHFKYYNLTRKKLKGGQFTDEDRRMIKLAKQFINTHYKPNIKFVKTFDYNVREIIREQKRLHLNEGYSAFLYDTFKPEDASDIGVARGSMVEDSKALFQFASKYNVPQIITAQLATYLEKTSWLTSQVLASSKQTKEVCSEIFLMRKCIKEIELDPNNKYYINPYRLKRDINGKWRKETFEIDHTLDGQYRIVFVDKTRNDEDSKAILYKYDGHINVWHELGFCSPSRIDFLR
ncbi:DNA helicase [Neobacillus sp. YIM B02564]|uniref:DNA helicase n=1 Tax=Neobacillus paridis TaxID=2803862 RepID=A0ABS1TID0_9BACI|nr:DnaB-like helicase C-terminal domain-containing protein [Neobacillus paridis]MBL4951067.1 DNA helicase [Neobacillus paridis]